MKAFLFAFVLPTLLFFHMSRAGSTPEIDSLKSLLAAPPSDTVKLNLLNELAFAYNRAEDSKTSVKFAEEALALAEKMKIQEEAAYALQVLGANHYALGNLEEAIRYSRRCYDIYNQIGNKKKAGFALGNLSNIYRSKGNYLKALEVSLQAIKLFEEIGERKYSARIMNGIGSIYWGQKNFEKALKYYEESAQIKEEIGDKSGLSNSLINIGIIHREKGDFNTAIAYQEKALKLKEELGDKSGIGFVFNNLGVAYGDAKDFKSKLNYHKKALEISLSLGEKENIAYAYGEIGNAYAGLNQYQEAESAYLKGANIAKEVGGQQVLMDIYLPLSQFYDKTQNFGAALQYYKEYVALKDSLLNAEKNAQITEIHTKYETEKKDQEIELLNKNKALQAAELKEQTLYRNILIVFVLLIMVIVLVLFRYFKLQQEHKRQQLSLKLKEEQLEAERLQALDKVKSRFFANIAHEFRTPLTLILGPAERIQESTKEESTRYEAGMIKRFGENLLRLVNQLLDLSKLESGIIQLHFVKEDLNAFLKGVTMSFESLAATKNVILKFGSEEPFFEADIDRNMTDKIFYNLIANAIKFTSPSGEVTVTVRKKYSTEKQNKAFAEILVKDTGIGIPEDKLSLVFNRFYQVDESLTRERGGSGIGLALTKELVELHGGTIAVSSGAGLGTVFTVQLPVCQEEGQSNPTSVVDTKAGVSPMEAYRKEVKEQVIASEGTENSIAQEQEEIILIIEDNEDVRNLIKRSINTDYQILEASNGEEGVELAIKHIPDLIISDVMMPQMDGYEACRVLKQDERTSHIPVILLTAKAGIDSKLEGLETGADDYLSKPFNAKELSVRIKNLITLRKNLRAKYSINEILAPENTSLPVLENVFIQKIKEVVENHLDEEDFSIEDLSKALAMSRTQVHRKLKALTNQSASQFMRSVRLDHALKLLKTGNFNVSEVAYKVGFNTHAYFSTCFTEHYGYPPSEVKNSMGKMG